MKAIPLSSVTSGSPSTESKVEPIPEDCTFSSSSSSIGVGRQNANQFVSDAEQNAEENAEENAVFPNWIKLSVNAIRTCSQTGISKACVEGALVVEGGRQS